MLSIKSWTCQSIIDFLLSQLNAVQVLIFESFILISDQLLSVEFTSSCHIVPNASVFLQESPPDIPLFELFLIHDLQIDFVLNLQLSLKLCLLLPLSFLELMLNSLSLNSWPPHDLFFLSTPICKFCCSFFIQLTLICNIEPKFKGIQILAKDLKINISVASPPEGMKQIVKLLIIDIEIIFKEKFSQLRNANTTSFMVVDMFKSIVRLYVFKLFSNDLNNSKSFENFKDQWDEMTLNLCSKRSSGLIDWLDLPSKGSKFI